MKSKVQITWMAGALLLAALMVLAACEDSGLTAPSDGLLTLTANPATVTIDPNLGETETQALITAAVFDAGGRPLQNRPPSPSWRRSRSASTGVRSSRRRRRCCGRTCGSCAR